MRNFKKAKSTIKFINQDAINYEFSNETIIFLFFPFGEKTLINVLDSIKKSLSTNPRKIKIISYVIGSISLHKVGWLKYNGKIGNTSFYLWTYD